MRVPFGKGYFGYVIKSSMVARIIMPKSHNYKSLEPCLIQEHEAPKKIIKKAKATRRSLINNPIQGRSY